MIDYKKLFAMKSFINNKKAIQAFANKCSFFWYDKRECTAFRKFLSAPRPLNKYYFTDDTMKRVEAMDLSKVPYTYLESIYEKYGDECGFVFADDEKIHFTYTITTNQIILLCFKGKDGKGYLNQGVDPYYFWVNFIVGGAILSYSGDNKFLSNSFFGVAKNVPEILRQDKSYWKKFKNFADKAVSLGFTEDNMFSDEALKSICCKSDYFKQEKELDDRQLELIEKCVKMFLFIKTAKVMDLTFITEGGKSKPYNPSHPRQQGVIVVDSFYDADINVINPFQVSGHFRNQPKKNDKGEWYKELIYIDSYMKQGYHRKAKISVINQQKDELLKMELKER